MKPAATSLYISHGGGPMPLLGDPEHKEMIDTLQQIAAEIPEPEAIVLVSAHWEEDRAAVTVAPQPPLLYDYYGFPPESYEIQYPCVGNPELAMEIMTLLGEADINCNGETSRGFDHGLFVPLKILFPKADIPCVQLSLVNNLDPETHINIGRALKPLTQKNVLVIGSGFSFHNMRAFFAPPSAEISNLNQSFESWMIDTCTNSKLTEAQRHAQLLEWSKAPGARFCHPREEHLLPLHVCYGIAETPAKKAYTATILNKQSSMYLW